MQLLTRPARTGTMWTQISLSLTSIAERSEWASANPWGTSICSVVSIKALTPSSISLYLSSRASDDRRVTSGSLRTA